MTKNDFLQLIMQLPSDTEFLSKELEEMVQCKDMHSLLAQHNLSGKEQPEYVHNKIRVSWRFKKRPIEVPNDSSKSPE